MQNKNEALVLSHICLSRSCRLITPSDCVLLYQIFRVVPRRSCTLKAVTQRGRPFEAALLRLRWLVEDVGLEFQRPVVLTLEDMCREPTYRLSVLIRRRPIRSAVHSLVGAASFD